MAAKILQFNQYKKVNFIDLHSNNEGKDYDIELDINGRPFLMKGIKPTSVRRDTVEYTFGSFVHNPKENKENKGTCPFCKNGFEASTVCTALTNDKDEYFNKHLNEQLIMPILFSFYNEKTESYLLEQSNKELPGFKPLFYGVSDGTHFQCVFEYKGEVLVFQDLIQGNLDEFIPLVYYWDEENKRLALYFEYLLPQTLLPIINRINHHLHKPDRQIFDTSGMDLVDIINNFQS